MDKLHVYTLIATVQRCQYKILKKNVIVLWTHGKIKVSDCKIDTEGFNWFYSQVELIRKVEVGRKLKRKNDLGFDK